MDLKNTLKQKLHDQLESMVGRIEDLDGVVTVSLSRDIATGEAVDSELDYLRVDLYDNDTQEATSIMLPVDFGPQRELNMMNASGVIGIWQILHGYRDTSDPALTRPGASSLWTIEFDGGAS